MGSTTWSSEGYQPKWVLLNIFNRKQQRGAQIITAEQLLNSRVATR
jgi:hypothetical protein